MIRAFQHMKAGEGSRAWGGRGDLYLQVDGTAKASLRR